LVQLAEDERELSKQKVKHPVYKTGVIHPGEDWVVDLCETSQSENSSTVYVRMSTAEGPVTVAFQPDANQAEAQSRLMSKESTFQ